MVLRKLKVRRFRTKKSRKGYFSFGVRIREKGFFYSRVNIDERRSIDCWKNNFFGAYRSEDGSYVLLSIEGISLFNSSWKNRRDRFLDRNSDEYQELRRLAKYGKPKDLEKYLFSVVGSRKL